MMHVLDENQTKLKNVGFEKNKKTIFVQMFQYNNGHDDLHDDLNSKHHHPSNKNSLYYVKCNLCGF